MSLKVDKSAFENSKEMHKTRSKPYIYEALSMVFNQSLLHGKILKFQKSQ